MTPVFPPPPEPESDTALPPTLILPIVPGTPLPTSPVPPRPALGGAYTLGKRGAVTEVGLDVAVEPVGEGGGGSLDACSDIRDRESVKSRDCALFVSDRGFVSCSLILASNSESDPRLTGSSRWRERWRGMPPVRLKQGMKLFVS